MRISTAAQIYVLPDLDDPVPPRELAALAAGLLVLDDARRSGLLDSDPAINRARCEELVDELWVRGIVATEEEIEAAALGLLIELGAVAS